MLTYCSAMTENIPDISEREMTGKHQACSVIITSHSAPALNTFTHISHFVQAVNLQLILNVASKGQNRHKPPSSSNIFLFSVLQVVTAAGLRKRSVYVCVLWGMTHLSRPENAGEQHVSTAPKQNKTVHIFDKHIC